MDRLDEIISVETYKQISSRLEEQKNKLQEELEEVESEYKQYSEENTSEKVLEAKELATEYLKKRKNMDRNLILKLVDRVEIHENKMVDLYLKIKPLEQVR